MKQGPNLATVAVLAASLTTVAVQHARAQTVVTTTTETSAEVTVTAHVTTTITQTSAGSAPVAVRELTAAELESEPAGLVPTLTLRAEMAVSGARVMPIAGTSALFGFRARDGWGGGVVAAYFAELGGGESQELHLALEAWRDFEPTRDVALLLVGRVGTALLLSDVGSRPDVIAQLGIGTRVSVDPRVAIFLDLRGELRVRASVLAATEGSLEPSTYAGALLTMGLAIDLD